GIIAAAVSPVRWLLALLYRLQGRVQALHGGVERERSERLDFEGDRYRKFLLDMPLRPRPGGSIPFARNRRAFRNFDLVADPVAERQGDASIGPYRRRYNGLHDR